MIKYKIAYVREQGQDLIVVPMARDFAFQTAADQQMTIACLQSWAWDAGLAGPVIPVWQDGPACRCVAPEPWQSLFEALSWDAILSNVNMELSN